MEEYDIHSALRRVPGKSMSDGYKRCGECTILLKHDGIFCPCCGGRLKKAHRNNLARQRATINCHRY